MTLIIFHESLQHGTQRLKYLGQNHTFPINYPQNLQDLKAIQLLQKCVAFPPSSNKEFRKLKLLIYSTAFKI